MNARSRMSGWGERLRGVLEQLLHTHDTPRRTALAFALGVFLGFSPLLGLHAILGLAFAFLFGLNRVAVIIGVYSNLPWILPAYYATATIAGAALLGVDVQPRALHEVINEVSATGWHSPREATKILAPFLWAFTLGSTIGAVILAAAAYQICLMALAAHRRRQELKKDQDPANL